MIEEIRARLAMEIDQLKHELHVVLPDTLQKARELGDLRENADFQAAIERQGFVHARLEQLRDRMSRLSSIDLNKVPRDRVGLGSVVTVLDLDTTEQEVLELVIPDAMDLDKGHVSVSSPLGRALLELAVGQEATVQLPIGRRRLKVETLRTIHEHGAQQVTPPAPKKRKKKRK
jgi:transcription elongation factor GreA